MLSKIVKPLNLSLCFILFVVVTQVASAKAMDMQATPNIPERHIISFESQNDILPEAMEPSLEDSEDSTPLPQLPSYLQFNDGNTPQQTIMIYCHHPLTPSIKTPNNTCYKTNI